MHLSIGEAAGQGANVAQPAAGAAASLRNATQFPSVASVATLLINDLADLSEDIVLVLDDYHVITTPDIHEALAFLLDYLPPVLHLVILTRADPPPLTLWSVMDEAVLRRQVGGRETMHAQLQRLITASEQPNAAVC